MRDSENMKGSKGEPPLQNEKKIQTLHNNKCHISVGVTQITDRNRKVCLYNKSMQSTMNNNSDLGGSYTEQK
jgi:hypothetical protein